ncbi:VRR-NUC domain-containing protein [Hymenobacter sp. BT664]|uniref:VRR-NUC domain-containing protein n=1 Tax=Hymenobacter montanus TaxID=2771359 RepID=A0A927GJF6_9BACT|nr:VRR-NUC domain-containing protein [Hymenobacter montanus]MBD2768447.1 VRR-NUC domain-containing protein [Hymenobacter montanus]
MPKVTTQTPLDFGTLTAEQITAAILGYLDAHGFTAWAQPNRGEYDPKTLKWRPHPNSRRGVPDILGFRRTDAKFLGVEVKAGSDRPRPEQTEFLNELKAAGGLAFIAYDFAGFVQSFERRGLHLVPTMATTAATTEAVPATTNHELLLPPQHRHLPPARSETPTRSARPRTTLLAE